MFVCSVLFCFVFRLYAFDEAAALRSIVLRYAGVPIDTRVSFFFFFSFFVYLEDVAFSDYFLYHFRFLFVWRVTSYALSFRMVFFLPCDHGLDFDISLCENSTNQSIPTAGVKYIVFSI